MSEDKEPIDPAIRKIMDIPDDQELPDDALCDVMIRALESHQLLIRASAVHQLVSLGKKVPQMALPRILAALNPEVDYWTVRFGALEALGEIASPNSINSLLKFLKEDKDPDFRAMVAKQFGEMGSIAVSAGPGLIAALKDQGSSEIRENAATALGKIKIKDAIEPLISTLEIEKDEYARRAMCWSLGELQDSKASGILLKMLKNKDKDTRANAAEAMGKIKHYESVIPLLEASKDMVVEVQAKAIWALKQYSSSVVISEIEKAAAGDPQIAIKYYDNFLFNVDNPEITKKVMEIKLPIIDNYKGELENIKAELASCKVFVEESFSKLRNMRSEEISSMMLELPEIENRIANISLYKYRKHKWLENDLFFELDQINSLYKESGVMVSELRDNAQLLLGKKKDEEARKALEQQSEDSSQ